MSAFGVKVLCLEPGFFKTSVTDLHLLRKNVKTLWDKLPEEIKAQYGHDYPERGNFFFFTKQTYTWICACCCNMIGANRIVVTCVTEWQTLQEIIDKDCPEQVNWVVRQVQPACLPAFDLDLKQSDIPFFHCVPRCRNQLVDGGKTFLPANVTLEKNVATLLDGDLMKVVSCMEHAISAVHPRTRYSPGWDAKFIWLPMSYLPTWIADKMLLKDMANPTGCIL